MKTFTAVDIDKRTPILVKEDPDGYSWAYFAYEKDDEPWNWPKFLSDGEMIFEWRSFNSDYNQVYYKELREDAKRFFPVEKNQPKCTSVMKTVSVCFSN